MHLPGLGETCPAYFDPVTTGVVQDPRVNEASGMVASVDHPGIYWVHNDSGDTARFFAIKEDGSVIATYNLLGVTAIDWEDMARGPGPVPGVSYLYFADIGDNLATRAFVTVYRIPEPTPPATAGATIDVTGAVALEMAYPDAAHDAETLLADPITGDLFIVTKCFFLSGCSDGVSKVYRYPAPRQDGIRVTLEEVASITFSGTAFAHAATAGDVSPAGDRIVVRTYTQALAWNRAPGSRSATRWTPSRARFPSPPNRRERPSPSPATAPATRPSASSPRSRSSASTNALRIRRSPGGRSPCATAAPVRIPPHHDSRPRPGKSAPVTPSSVTQPPRCGARGLPRWLHPTAQTFVLLPSMTSRGIRCGAPSPPADSATRIRWRPRTDHPHLPQAVRHRNLRLARCRTRRQRHPQPPSPESGNSRIRHAALPGGDRYCVRYGADAHVRNAGATLFHAQVRAPKAARPSEYPLDRAGTAAT